MVARIQVFLDHPSQTPAAWLLGGISYVAICVFALTFGLKSAATEAPTSFLRPISLTALRTRAARRRIALGLVGGLVVGLVGALGVGLTVSSRTGLTGGLIVGLVGGLGSALVGGLESNNLNVVTPASTVYSDLLYWLGFGFTFGFVLGLAGALRAGVGLGVGFALMHVAGFVLGLAAGVGAGAGQMWLRYVLGVASAAAPAKLPFRLIRYLDECARSGILRRSGPAYQFRHLSLRDHLQGKPVSITAIRLGGPSSTESPASRQRQMTSLNQDNHKKPTKKAPPVDSRLVQDR